MTAVFYKESTAMVGVDFHPLDTAAPDPAVVGAIYGMSGYAGKRTTSVLADGESMIQEGCSMMFVPHAALPETPMGAARLIAVIAGSSSKAVLAVHSVHGNGEALACAIMTSTGLNLNCNSPFNALTGATLSFGTVVTKPTAIDFAVMGATIAYDMAWSWGRSKLFRSFDPMMQKWSDNAKEVAKAMQSVLAKLAKDAVKQVVDPPKDLEHYLENHFR